MDERLAVGVADHVVVEDDEAEAREIGGPRLQRIAGSLRRALGPLLHQRLDVLLGALEEPAASQCPCGESTAGRFPSRPTGR